MDDDPAGLPADRRKLSVLLTDVALDGWHLFCDEHRVTLTAVLEIVGRKLDAGLRVPLDLDEVVSQARALDFDRLRKRGRRRRD